ncbi:UDPglucose 6-dehydrogenase [Xanthobacter flavus]|nr:UDP-glucose/GDP-mannose dehydrogenase family protein [Xanthobacter flavus]MBP2151666.1 UDPglucose 6-dehydrogenase [Xanthobacter flavus]
MQVAMIGAGYVGLVSGACFSDFGHRVTCVDTDTAKIAALKGGEIPIYEPGLSELVATNVAAERLFFTTDLAGALEEAEAVFIAVGTPSRRGDGHADLSYVYQAARDIARAIRRYTVVVTKSTVPVGTGDEVERIIRELRPDAEFAVVSNPEFLREGAAITDFKRPDRIVVGTEDERAKQVMTDLYRPLYLNQAPLLFTSRRTAELTKYAANAFLATKITFINEIADLCEKVGGNVQDVARGIGLDNRIGSKFLHAGPGYGGSCFPKDTLALIKTAQDHGAPTRIVETVVAVNDQRKRAMARKVIQALGGSVRGRTVGILGLTFKPNTDDMRDAPSIAIITALQDAGAIVRAHDPEGVEQARLVLSDVTYVDSPYEAATGADALVIVTEWDAFRALDLKRIRALMGQPVVVDLRNIYRSDEWLRWASTIRAWGVSCRPAETFCRDPATGRLATQLLPGFPSTENPLEAMP